MKKQNTIRVFQMVCILVLLSLKAHAAWTGIGVSGGTGGSNICNTANWVGNTIDGDFSTINTAGTYMLTMSSDLNRAIGSTGASTGERFNFGCPVDGVQLTIASDAPGTPRTLTSGGVYRMGSITATTTNSVTFSADIRFNVVSALIIAQSTAFGSGALLPACTVNGSMTLGAPLKHTGCVLTLNGYVSGSGSLTIGGNIGAQAYTTLTCPSNTFSGGILAEAARQAQLTATASTVLANTGQPSALGSGGPICFPLNSIYPAPYNLTLSGFSAPQTTDRIFVLASRDTYLFNNGTGPLRLTGAITNNASDVLLYMGIHLTAVTTRCSIVR